MKVCANGVPFVEINLEYLVQQLKKNPIKLVQLPPHYVRKNMYVCIQR